MEIFSVIKEAEAIVRDYQLAQRIREGGVLVEQPATEIGITPLERVIQRTRQSWGSSEEPLDALLWPTNLGV